MAFPLKLAFTAAISVVAIVAVVIQLRLWTPASPTVEIEIRSEPPDRLDQLVARFGGDAADTALKDALAAERRTVQIAHELLVDACEVTQADFHRFSFWYAVHEKHRLCSPQEPKQFLHRSLTRDNPGFGQNALPVGAVTLFDAVAYCSASGGRVPSDDEWEAISTGRQGRRFPWGSQPTIEPWREVHDYPRPCRTFPYTDTPEGISDMATGVSEWTLRATAPLQGARSGGNAHRFASELYAYGFLHLPVREGPLYRDPFLGFRCVYDRPPAAQRAEWGSDFVVRTVAAGAYPLGPPAAATSPTLLRMFSMPEVVEHLRRTSAAGSAPPRRIRVMQYEVTRSDYWRFVMDPFVRLGLYTDPQAPAGHSHVPNSWKEQMKSPSLPVTGVDWWDARAYARWVGGRLPSAEEWSKIASSSSRNVYPWEGPYKPGAACARDAGCASPVGPKEFLSDTTPSGVRHLAGNVSEWTTSVIRRSGDDIWAAVSGGNFRLDGSKASFATFQASLPFGFRDAAIGFRVVFD